MYRPPAFAEDDPQVLAGLLAEGRLATLIAVVDGQAVVDHLPMLHVADGGPFGRLVGHLARANPQAAAEAEGRAVTVVMVTAEAYVSPSAYPSKAEHGRAVPTWNYVAVHAHGRLHRIEDRERLTAIVAALTERHEAGRAHPWAVADAPADYFAAQLKGIVGIEIVVERLEGKRKLSQNRSAADRAGVIADLAGSEAEGDRAVAAAMIGEAAPTA